MNVYEMLERVKEYDPTKQRTRILRDLNQAVVDFARETRLLTASSDLLTQDLTDNDGWLLADEKGETLVSSTYGSMFPLPSDCYSLIALECSDETVTYKLEHGKLSFYWGTTVQTFLPDTNTVLTLHYNKRASRLSRDDDTPEFHEDFHIGPVWKLLAAYAAVKGDKMFQYFASEAQQVKFEAQVYASRLGRQSFDVKSLDWST